MVVKSVLINVIGDLIISYNIHDQSIFSGLIIVFLKSLFSVNNDQNHFYYFLKSDTKKIDKKSSIIQASP